MKILDRYVLVAFLKNYLLSLVVLIGLYVVLDMVFQFDELTENVGSTGGFNSFLIVAGAVSDYYFHQSFLIFAHLAGIIPLVAAAFTILRMTRNNELAAIMAAGVPLLRVVAPVIFAAVVLNVLVVMDQELIIPAIVPKLTRSPDQLLQQSTKTYPITAMRDDRGALLNASRYSPPTDTEPARMQVFDLIERNDASEPVAHVRADEAVWDRHNQQWNLTNGFRVIGLLPNQHRSKPEPTAAYKSSVTPDEVALHRSGDFVELLSTERINELLQRQQSFRVADLLRVKHSRIAQWILNLVLMLLAIPCVLSREPTQLKASAMKSLFLVGSCMAMAFICQQLAGQPAPGGSAWADRWPAILAWLPIFIFSPIAILLLDRVHTKGS